MILGPEYARSSALGTFVARVAPCNRRRAGKNRTRVVEENVVSDSSTQDWPAPFEPLRPRLDSTLPSSSASGGRDELALHDAFSSAEPCEELSIVEIIPRARPTPLRLVGPGRRERAYLEQAAALEQRLARSRSERRELEERARDFEARLALVSLLERGAERRLDRVEQELATRGHELALRGHELATSARELALRARELREKEQRENRLILALGALQNENQRLAAEIAKLNGLPAAPRPALGRGRERSTPERRGLRAWLRGWLGA
jgi:hypothetical protein